MNELESFFSSVSKMVDASLDKLIPSESIEPGHLHEAVRWSVFGGGKRFRPALLVAVGRTFGTDDEKLLTTAAAIEMIHTYSLVHDDLPAMDDDDLRRGRQTCHKRFGEAAAILAGDVLQTLAFKSIADDGTLGGDVRLRLISELAAASGTPNGMVAGQSLDLDGEGKDLSIEQTETIHRAKTGALIRASGRAGALIADADGRELEAISEYSACLGLLFQITDDLLDVTQTTSALGKTAGKDAAAEKATYPAIYGVEGTRKLAEEAFAGSVAHLDRLGRPAGILHDIAAYILKRES